MEALVGIKSLENRVTIPTSARDRVKTASGREGSEKESDDSRPEPFTSFNRVTQEMKENMEKAYQVLNEYVRSTERSLKIQVQSGTGKTVVQVISKEDGRVIREIPPEEVLNLAAKMKELGFLFDEKV